MSNADQQPTMWRRQQKENGICYKCKRKYDGVKWLCATCREIKNAKQRIYDKAKNGRI